MAKMDLISYLLRIDNYKLSKIEKTLLEVKLFTEIYKELQNFFKNRYKDYLGLIKSTSAQESNMLNINVPQEIIADIISTKEYSFFGIANNLNIPEEVLSDIVSGINTNPTLELSRKLFELHMTVRRAFYDSIIQKIFSQYINLNPDSTFF